MAPQLRTAPLKVRKRNGDVADYQQSKITQVVRLCLVNGCARSDNEETDTFAKRVSDKVDATVRKLSGPVNVEAIQDLVTIHLELEDPAIAQAFRTYREQHRQLRLQNVGLFAKRTAFKPFEYPQFSVFKDAIRHSYWVHTEWNFVSDIHDFKSKLDPAEQNAIKNALLAISQIEIAVKRFWTNLGQRFPKPEIEQVGVTFGESEVRHADAYSHLVQILGLSDDFAKVVKVPAIRARIEYLSEALKPDSTDDRGFSLTLALFSMFIENCSLFSQFAVIKSFAKHRTMLKDVDNVVQATQREETIHAMFGAALINEIKNERPEWFDDDFWFRVASAARDAFEAESRIVDWIFEEGELSFLSAATLKEFVKHRINESLAMIGGQPVFAIDTDLLKPLGWFEEELKLDVSIDFFHTKSTAYAKHTQSYKGLDIVRDEQPEYDPTKPGKVADQVDVGVAPPLNAEPYDWLNEASRAVLYSDYLLPGQTPEGRIEEIADAATQQLNDPTFKDRFLSYMQQGFYSLASPIWSNFGLDRGLPISCFGSYVEDDMIKILESHTEAGVMSKFGGGTSGYYGEVRPRGSAIRDNGTSAGSVHFMQLPDTLIRVVSQGSTRRGQYAAYLPIDHPDIEEFLTLRSDGNPVQGLSFGVCISDQWMDELLAEEKAVKDGYVCDTPRLDLWGRVLEHRSKTGYPYLFFSGNANRQAPAWYREQGYTIHHSNLCTEIMLPNGPDESFVCDLSSLNLHRWPEIEAAGVDDVVFTIAQLLDAVMSEFIEKAGKVAHMEKAVRFAKRHRALGIGVLGWHSYFQRLRLPIESFQAHQHNGRIFATIRRAADNATERMAELYGEPEVLKGYGRRNATMLAIAPTKTSSFILGQTSEGIEPWRKAVVVKKTQKGTFTVRNPELERLLDLKCRNDDATWQQIIDAGGSVQGLDCLTEHEKAVFKTFAEISPMALVAHAAQRQKYIDQGQSLNLLIDPKVPAKQISDLYVKGWEMGIKSFYYHHGVNAAHQLASSLTACTSCEA